MKSERFYCKSCKSFFDKPKFCEERHGLDSPPYEKIAICARCGGDDFVKHNNFVEKIEVAEKILSALMYLNRYCNALSDIYGISLKNDELNCSVEIMVEAISEMFNFLDNDDERQLFKFCSEGELQRILIRLKG